jgi:hypothetical protein
MNRIARMIRAVEISLCDSSRGSTSLQPGLPKCRTYGAQSTPLKGNGLIRQQLSQNSLHHTFYFFVHVFTATVFIFGNLITSYAEQNAYKQQGGLG